MARLCRRWYSSWFSSLRGKSFLSLLPVKRFWSPCRGRVWEGPFFVLDAGHYSLWMRVTTVCDLQATFILKHLGFDEAANATYTAYVSLCNLYGLRRRGGISTNPKNQKKLWYQKFIPKHHRSWEINTKRYLPRTTRCLAGKCYPRGEVDVGTMEILWLSWSAARGECQGAEIPIKQPNQQRCFLSVISM